jgi:V/A-type H+-transporting ATPase subunit D
MAIRFQYNKTSLQALEKQLKIRRQALPILKNKEAALRVEVKKARREAEALQRRLQESIQEHETMIHLWNTFDFSLLKVERVDLAERKIAGVNTPVLEKMHFHRKPFSLFNRPAWYPDGLELLEEWTSLELRHRLMVRRTELLEHARKKTTQKVNLYEKVQIPDYEDAIRQIKRYLEDEENLAKAAQKIVKKRKEEARP